MALYIVNISATTAAGTIILFVYLEITLLKLSNFNKTDKIYDICFYLLYAISVIQFIVYILTPVGTYFEYYSATYAFWFSTVFIVLGIIPFFCIVGSIAYCRIKRNTIDTNKKK